MFLLDAHVVATGIALLFKSKGKTGMWLIPKYDYVYVDACSKHRSEYGTPFNGRVYSDAERDEIQLYRVNALRTNLHCDKCKAYDTGLDMKAKNLYDAGLEMYRFYTYDGNTFIGEKEGSTIDPRKLKIIPEHANAPSWKQELKVVTLSFRFSTNGEFGPVIPHMSDLLIRASGWSSEGIVNSWGYTSFINIKAQIGTETKEFNNPDVQNPATNELKLLKSFLEWFREEDPDIVQMFNTIQLEFLYHRCKFYSIEILFIECMNRLKFNTFSRTDYARKNVPQYYDNTYKCNTQFHLNYTEFSKDSTKFTFKNTLVGRVLFNYFAMAPKRDVLDETPKRITYWHSKFLNQHLPTLMWITGSYHMTVDYYVAKLVMTQWIVKKEYGSLLVFEDIGQKTKRTHDDMPLTSEMVKLDIGESSTSKTATKKNKKEERGGAHHEVTEPKLYRSTETAKIFGPDMVGYYGGIIDEANLDLTTLVKAKELPDGCTMDDILIFGSHRFLKSSKKRGIIPRIIGNLRTKRADIKKQQGAKNFRSEFDQDLLAKQSNALKLATAIVYGCLGNTHVSNRIMAPEIMEITTEIGRFIWRELKSFLEERRHTVIHGNTDGYIVYTEFPKALPLDLQEFVDLCPIKCQPEIREEFNAVYVVNSTSWIGVDANGRLINKNVIQSKNSEVQIHVETLLYSVLLSETILDDLVPKLLRFFEQALIDWADIYDPYSPENYFMYYHSKSPKFKLFFSPIQNTTDDYDDIQYGSAQLYSEHIQQSVYNIFALASKNGVLVDSDRNLIDRTISACMPH